MELPKQQWGLAGQGQAFTRQLTSRSSSIINAHIYHKDLLCEVFWAASLKLACYIREGLLTHGIKSVFRLPRALVESLFLEVFTHHVDEASGDMG